jgi:peptidoglycan hydrolase-like protein with peptidoglycan-binding domain
MRSARQLDEHETWSLGDGVNALLGLIARNPVVVGGSTAFLVALSFVSANALWYQPHPHSGAFFATRDFVRSPSPELPGELPNETRILIERPERPRQVAGDPTVREVQETLRELNFYGGDVDGLFGPNTRQAIEAYQSKMGMPVTGTIDDSLLDHLGAGPTTVVLPSPAPRDKMSRPAVLATGGGREEAVARPVSLTRDERVAKVQAGLKEFGNEAIEVDGLMGARTTAAIREFQSLFGLQVTGDADQATYSKMKEIGLIQ